MIRLNKQEDYAILLMSQLASQPAIRWSADDISNRLGISVPQVKQLARHLKQGGLITSKEGSGGGYILSRKPASITFYDIISSVSGPIKLTNCVSTDQTSCIVAEICPIHSPLQNIQDKLCQLMKQTTLDKLTI